MAERDHIFEEEQAHLRATYQQLEDICAHLEQSIEDRLQVALGSRNDLKDNLAVDFGNGVNLETYVEYEAIHKIIDEFNLSLDLDTERLVKARVLLRRPYFAKISVQIRPDAPARDLYIGAAGMADDKNHRFIIDWRAPIAELYYNQSNGKTSYVADGRTINADLKLRRQFDITGDVLHQYFDTTVAIEDALLLQSLSKDRSAKLQDITATIQREQNKVVRHDDVDVLLVEGVAGSGKTSIMLQRIAYLFFQQRDTLRPDQVHLISPNPVFRDYIDDVLPSMGERNPHIETWEDIMAGLGLEQRGMGLAVPAQDLREIDARLSDFELEKEDFQDLYAQDERVISAAQAWRAYCAYKRFPTGVHRCSLTMEDLHEMLDQRIKGAKHRESVWELIESMDEEEQLRVFGCHIFTLEDKELAEYVEPFLADRYRAVEDAIEAGDWLRIDRIGMRLLGKQSLSAGEWLYLKLALVGNGCRDAKFVMIDEVQDYTETQLMVLARYFNNAHFLLLGDENQAIKEGTVPFSAIHALFKALRGQETCTCQLITSYRSTPEITQLFKSLMVKQCEIEAASVRQAGVLPRLLVRETEDEYWQTLFEELRAAQNYEGLVAVIANNKPHLKLLKKRFHEAGLALTVLEGGVALPSAGVVLLDLRTAKGLEFDSVLIADVSSRAYDASEHSKKCLYTAISRATQNVTLLSNGQANSYLANNEYLHRL